MRSAVTLPLLLAASSFTGSPLNASSSSSPPPPQAPWFTGTLLAPTGTVVPAGSGDQEVYVYTTVDTGIYDAHSGAHSTPHFTSVDLQWTGYFGLNSWMNLQTVTSFLYNKTEGVSSVCFGDFVAELDIQLFSDTASSYFPGIMLALEETFPTGRYQKLSPHKRLTDLSGQGTYGSSVELIFYKIYEVFDQRFLSLTYSLAYQVNTSVHVRGLNAYGGGSKTRGKVHPGSSFETILSFEYQLTQNWVLALDNVYEHVNKSPFSGRSGGVPVGLPSSELVSFAPAIEYNFNANFGIIAGAWVTGFGRNATRFRSAVVNFNYTW